MCQIITTKIRIVAIFVKNSVVMFLVYLRNGFYTSGCSSQLLIASKWRDKYGFYAVFMLLFYTLQKQNISAAKVTCFSKIW
jgi:hypothetical protein